ncbi:hypothetical protein ElyMa_003292100 [Elysia marginata]|uniref:Uncharacterized protein n=1 Tax=Elysia marginata TaxID=1093978 RepID=A0AAV4J9R8_9GAST|nr:hypothetical protein ElyMa_003292100 [Elysia marginata]
MKVLLILFKPLLDTVRSIAKQFHSPQYHLKSSYGPTSTSSPASSSQTGTPTVCAQTPAVDNTTNNYNGHRENKISLEEIIMKMASDANTKRTTGILQDMTCKTPPPRNGQNLSLNIDADKLCGI